MFFIASPHCIIEILLKSTSFLSKIVLSNSHIIIGQDNNKLHFRFTNSNYEIRKVIHLNCRAKLNIFISLNKILTLITVAWFLRNNCRCHICKGGCQNELAGGSAVLLETYRRRCIHQMDT